MCMQTCIEGRWALYSRHGVHVRKYNSDSSIESNNGEDDAKILEGKGEEVDEERAACCQQCYVSTRCLPDLGEVVLRISLVRTTSAYFKQRQASKQ